MSVTDRTPYSLKRDGRKITDCEAEPIQAPGCIQGHGVLIAVRASDLTILQVSENCADFFDQGPADLLGERFETLFPPALVERLRWLLEHEPVERNPLYVATLEFRPGGLTVSLDLSVHTIDGCALLELEPTGCEGGNSPPDYYALVKITTGHLHAATDLESFCTIAAQQVRRITGLDRVMIYRFHPDATGDVFAEDKRSDMEAWKGQLYPAYDIPKIARDIFKKITIRPLQNATGPLAELVPLVNPDTGRALELTHCALRGASRMYTEYLANMGAAASLTMPILRNGELWGMIACQHGVPTRFPLQMRAAAEFVAQVISLELQAVNNSEHLEYARRINSVHRELIARAAEEGSLAGMMTPRPGLDKGIESAGAALLFRDRWSTGGKTPGKLELEELGVWLRKQLLEDPDSHPFFATDRLSAVYPGGSQLVREASGVLAVPVSHDCRDLIVWFRPETIQIRRWGGNPHEQPTFPGQTGSRPAPRADFATWKETLRERSAPWTEMEIEAALKLRSLAMELASNRTAQIPVPTRESAKSSEELNALAYAATHDLKDPLHSVYEYACYLKKEAEAGRTFYGAARGKLDALLRLTARMDGVLDSLLHFSRVGRLELKYEDVALEDLVRESAEMLEEGIAAAGAQIVIPRVLPRIRCDRLRVREIFLNLLSNALRFNDSDSARIEIGFFEPGEARPGWSSSPAEASKVLGRVFYVRDNGIGIEPRHQEVIFDMFKRLHGPDEYGGGTGAGLAITRKLIEQHGGSIWVDSRPGQGTAFYFTLVRKPGEMQGS
jgi:chemotaxis family two-component system sensor kinase Cph1